MKIENGEISFKVHLKKDIKNPAMLTLFIGPYQIKGFAIRKVSDDKKNTDIFLAPPAKKVTGGWFKLFWVDNELWKELEKMAISEFGKELLQSLK